MGLGDTFKKLVGIEDVEDDFTEEDIAAAKAQLAKEETRRPVSSFQPKPAGTENKGRTDQPEDFNRGNQRV